MPVEAAIERKVLLITIDRPVGGFPQITARRWMRLRPVETRQWHRREPRRLLVVKNRGRCRRKALEHRVEILELASPWGGGAGGRLLCRAEPSRYQDAR